MIYIEKIFEIYNILSYYIDQYEDEQSKYWALKTFANYFLSFPN